MSNNDYQIIKVGDLPVANTLEGLNILGFDSTNNRAVRALMALLKGLDGKPVELQKTATHLQWRIQGGTWANLLTLDEIKGAKGDPNTLSIGTVQGGTNAGATITGTAPNQTLNLTLPKGDTGTKGDKGDKGDVGPANTLSIGTVKSGETSGASITGEAPNQTLNLTLEKGDTGNSGVYVGSEEPTDPNVKVWIDVTGSEDGNWIKEW